MMSASFGTDSLPNSTKIIEPELTEHAKTILEKRYLRRDADGNVIETPQEMFWRIAKHVAHGESLHVGSRIVYHEPEVATTYYNLMASLKFLPNSPTIRNAGTGKGCLSACFCVTPEDDLESIMETAHDAAMIEKWGGGIGFGFSKLRSKNSSIGTTHGNACGPVAVMKLYSKVGETLTQGAFRLGAHMGQLRCNHADIREFIHVKDNDNTISNFNISVQITDDFMRAVANDENWILRNPKDDSVVETVRARVLWQEICESAWRTGDPGVVFIDRIWETAPNPQMGKIETSNPCGEEFLENYSNCCLGSINLAKHTKNGKFDYDEFEKTIRTAVRFLDNVIDVNEFPLTKLREVNLATRRIGLGIMGWADLLLKLKVPYDSEKAIHLADKVGKFLVDTAWNESEQLAKERGAFPEWERSRFAKEGRTKVRNSSVITIAPTGTISLIAGCSSGIEPYFSLAWTRKAVWKEQDKPETATEIIEGPAAVVSYVGNSNVLKEIALSTPYEAEQTLKKLGLDTKLLRTTVDISPEWHVKVQATWQKYVTNSVSKTINMPNSATVEEVASAFEMAWRLKCKAVTVYRDGSKSMQVLETGATKKPKTETSNNGNGNHSVRTRPETTSGHTYKVPTAYGTLYVTVNGEKTEPIEVFAHLGKSGGFTTSFTEAIGRLMSLCLRSGIAPKDVIKQLEGIRSPQASFYKGERIYSIPDALAKVLRKHTGEVTNTSTPVKNGDSPECPECNGDVELQEGCMKCRNCGYARC